MLFIAYYGSVSLFTHVHVEQGTTIVHAHPFKKTADGTCHQHGSLAEIQLFHILSSIHLSEEPVYPSYVAEAVGRRYLRAPPVQLTIEN